MNYSSSSIYKLCCNNPEIKEIYIGSTTNFRQRKCGHKSCCNNINDKHYNVYVYQFIRDNGGWDNWDMVLIEKYAATDKRDLHTKERHWIETLGSNLNKIIPTRTDQEYYQNNKESIKDHVKQYSVKNKDKIKQRSKIYFENNRDQIKLYKKKYNEKNKESINEKGRQHRANQFTRKLHEFIYS